MFMWCGVLLKSIFVSEGLLPQIAGDRSVCAWKKKHNKVAKPPMIDIWPLSLQNLAGPYSTWAPSVTVKSPTQLQLHISQHPQQHTLSVSALCYNSDIVLPGQHIQTDVWQDPKSVVGSTNLPRLGDVIFVPEEGNPVLAHSESHSVCWMKLTCLVRMSCSSLSSILRLREEVAWIQARMQTRTTRCCPWKLSFILCPVDHAWACLLECWRRSWISSLKVL